MIAVALIRRNRLQLSVSKDPIFAIPFEGHSFAQSLTFRVDSTPSRAVRMLLGNGPHACWGELLLAANTHYRRLHSAARSKCSYYRSSPISKSIASYHWSVSPQRHFSLTQRLLNAIQNKFQQQNAAPLTLGIHPILFILLAIFNQSHHAIAMGSMSQTLFRLVTVEVVPENATTCNV